MLTSYIEKLILLLLAIAIISIFAIFLAAYVLLIVIGMSIITGGIYAYPYLHTAGVGLTEKIADLVGIPDGWQGLRYIGFTIVLWLAIFLCFLGLLSTCLKALGVISVSTSSLIMSVSSLSILGSLVFGIAIGIYPRAINPVSNGPLERITDSIREKLGSNSRYYH